MYFTQLDFICKTIIDTKRFYTVDQQSEEKYEIMF